MKLGSSILQFFKVLYSRADRNLSINRQLHKFVEDNSACFSQFMTGNDITTIEALQFVTDLVAVVSLFPYEKACLSIIPLYHKFCLNEGWRDSIRNRINGMPISNSVFEECKNIVSSLKKHAIYWVIRKEGIENFPTRRLKDRVRPSPIDQLLDDSSEFLLERKVVRPILY